MCSHFFLPFITRDDRQNSVVIVKTVFIQLFYTQVRNRQLKVIILVSLIKCPTFSGRNYCCDCPFNCGAQATKLSGICAQATTLQKILFKKLSRLSCARANPLNHMRTIGNITHTGSISVGHLCFAPKKIHVILHKQARK